MGRGEDKEKGGGDPASPLTCMHRMASVARLRRSLLVACEAYSPLEPPPSPPPPQKKQTTPRSGKTLASDNVYLGMWWSGQCNICKRTPSRGWSEPPATKSSLTGLGEADRPTHAAWCFAAAAAAAAVVLHTTSQGTPRDFHVFSLSFSYCGICLPSHPPWSPPHISPPSQLGTTPGLL